MTALTGEKNVKCVLKVELWGWRGTLVESNLERRLVRLHDILEKRFFLQNGNLFRLPTVFESMPLGNEAGIAIVASILNILNINSAGEFLYKYQNSTQRLPIN